MSFIKRPVFLTVWLILMAVAGVYSLYSYTLGAASLMLLLPNMPSWAFTAFTEHKEETSRPKQSGITPKQRCTWDDKINLSGSIAGGDAPFGPVSYFGAVPAECELLDGVFLAAKKFTLTANGILFDPCFDFHFYDMDFCRTARQKGLRLGTWPICLTHRSGGAFSSPPWIEKYRLYCEKWRT